MTLPDCLFDFVVRDSRDGEEYVFHNRTTAAREVSRWRNTLDSWSRCCIYQMRRLNKEKVALFLEMLR